MDMVFPEFHGAAASFTGSCFRARDATILIDCGMFQSGKTGMRLNYRPFSTEIAERLRDAADRKRRTVILHGLERTLDAETGLRNHRRP